MRVLWHSIHLYYSQVSAEEVILLLVQPLLDRLNDRKKVNRHFFIRYSDNIGTHIRFRAKLCLRTNGLEKYAKEIIVKSPKLSRYISCRPEKYEPEIERYGGRIGVEIAELHFMHSSMLVCKLLQRMPKWNYEMALGVSIPLTLIFLINGGLRKREMSNFFKFAQLSWKKTLGIESQEVETQLASKYEMHRNSVGSVVSRVILTTEQKKAFRDPTFDKWTIFSVKFHRDLDKLLSKGKIGPSMGTLQFHKQYNTPFKWSLLLSYVHMTNNRLGLLNTDELYQAYVLDKAVQSHFDEKKPTRPIN